MAPMSTQRSTAGVAVLHNKLYALGGRDGLSVLLYLKKNVTSQWPLVRILLPAQRGELRPAHKQVEPCCKHVQAARRCWGGSFTVLFFSLLSSFDIIWHLVLGGGGERVPLRHRRPRRTCRLQSSAVEVQLHGKVYSHSNWKNAFNCKYEPWISSITVIVTIVSWFRYDPATDTWTMVANLSVGRDAIGDKQSLFVYLLMLMHFYSRRLCVG